MNSGDRPRKSRTDTHNRPTPEQIRAMQEAIDARAKEVLGQIYNAVLKTPEFTLQDGTKCRVDAFCQPEVNSDGDLKCAFDVLMNDGTHLEFTVNHTGWGKSLAPGLAGKPRGPARGR
jgi:hypothetical protein